MSFFIISDSSSYSKDFLLVYDCAPIHVSFKTRTEIETLISPLGGHVCYLGAGCTDETQPLDINVFGGFKSSARSHHLSLIIDSLRNRPKVEKRKNLATTTETRLMVCLSLIYAWQKISDSSIINAWECSIGRLKKDSKEGFVSTEEGTLAHQMNHRAAAAQQRIDEEKVERDQHESTAAPAAASPVAAAAAAAAAAPTVAAAVAATVAAAAAAAAAAADDEVMRLIGLVPEGELPKISKIVTKADSDEDDDTSLPIEYDSDDESDEDVEDTGVSE